MARGGNEGLGFALWLLVMLAGAGVLTQCGCGTPATKARKVVAAVDVVNELVANGGRLGVTECADRARKINKTGDFARAQIELDKCKATLAQLDKVLTVSLDVTAVAHAAIDVGEAAGAKDYTTALAPLKEAVRLLVQLAKDAGLKIPPEALAAVKGLL